MALREGGRTEIITRVTHKHTLARPAHTNTGHRAEKRAFGGANSPLARGVVCWRPRNSQRLISEFVSGKRRIECDQSGNSLPISLSFCPRRSLAAQRSLIRLRVTQTLIRQSNSLWPMNGAAASATHKRTPLTKAHRSATWRPRRSLLTEAPLVHKRRHSASQSGASVFLPSSLQSASAPATGFSLWPPLQSLPPKRSQQRTRQRLRAQCPCLD